MPAPEFKIAGAYVEMYGKGDLGAKLQKAHTGANALNRTLSSQLAPTLQFGIALQQQQITLAQTRMNIGQALAQREVQSSRLFAASLQEQIRLEKQLTANRKSHEFAYNEAKHGKTGARIMDLFGGGFNLSHLFGKAAGGGGASLIGNMLGGAMTAKMAGGSALSGAGIGAGAAGGPWGMLIASGIQGFQMVFDFGKQIFGKILGLVQTGNPVAAERFNLAMQDLYGVIGFRLSPIITGATDAVRRFADAFLNSPTATELQRLSGETGRLISEFGKLLAESGAIDTFSTALKLATHELKFFADIASLLNKKPGGKSGESIGAIAMRQFNPLAQAQHLYEDFQRATGKGGSAAKKSSIGAGGGGDVGFSDVLAAKQKFQEAALKASAYGLNTNDPAERTAKSTEEIARLLREQREREQGGAPGGMAE